MQCGGCGGSIFRAGNVNFFIGWRPLPIRPILRGRRYDDGDDYDNRDDDGKTYHGDDSALRTRRHGPIKTQCTLCGIMPHITRIVSVCVLLYHDGGDDDADDDDDKDEAEDDALMMPK